MIIRPVELGVLCRMLRAAGLRVTAVHELRLQTVFRTFEDVPADRVVRLVAPVVISATEELEIVEDVVPRWLAGLPQVVRAQAALDPPAAVRSPERAVPTDAPVEASTGRRSGFVRLVVVAAVLGLAAIVVPYTLPSDGRHAAPDAGMAADANVAETSPPTIERPSGSYFRPSISVQGRAKSGAWFFGLLFMGGMVGGMALYLIRRRRPGLPPDLAPPAGRGGVAPPARPAPAPELARVTDARDQNALVWGVDHFLTESTGTRLDLAESVRATARAGDRPVVVWAQERQARAIWLWVDADAETEAVSRLAEEVRATLQANGLTVYLAWFAGLPDQLYVGHEVMLPEDLPTPPQEAVVAVLTDGMALTRVESGTAGIALSALRAWPQLAVVDFARGATDLSLRMRPYAIEVIAPEALARWLGGEGSSATAADLDLTPWLAALALSPTAVDPADAFRLGARLGLTHPARHLPALERDATVVGGRLTWPWSVRAERIDWLARQQDLLEITLDFWGLRHASAPGDTAMDRARAVERAWLTLFSAPVEAAPLLYAEPSRRPWIEEALLGLDVADATPRAGIARLPWRWSDVPPLVQVMLKARGLGGAVVAPVRPGRPWKAIAACAVAMIAGVVGLLTPQTAHPPEVLPVGNKPFGADFEVRDPDAQGHYGVVLSTLQDGELSTTWVQPNSVVEVTWAGTTAPCVQEQAPLERWFCGDQPPGEPVDGEWHFVIGAPADAPGAAGLARRLLDMGVAVEVIFDPGLTGEGYHRGSEEYGFALLGRNYVAITTDLSCDSARLRSFAYCVPNADFGALAAALEGKLQPVTTVWPTATGRRVNEARLPGHAAAAEALAFVGARVVDGALEVRFQGGLGVPDATTQVRPDGAGAVVAVTLKAQQFQVDPPMMQVIEGDAHFQVVALKNLANGAVVEVTLAGAPPATYRPTVLRDVDRSSKRLTTGQGLLIRFPALPTPANAPPSDAPPSDAPPSDAPPSDAPPSDAPPSDAPPSDAPPSEPAQAAAPTVNIKQGKLVWDLLITGDFTGYFAAGEPKTTPKGVSMTVQGLAALPGWKASVGDASLRSDGRRIQVDIRMEAPDPRLLSVMKPARVPKGGRTVRIRVPKVLSLELRDLLLGVEAEINKRLGALRTSGRAVDEACVARTRRQMETRVWDAITAMYAEDSDRPPAMVALAKAQPLNAELFAACLGERTLAPPVQEAITQLQAGVFQIREAARNAYVANDGPRQKCYQRVQGEAEGLLVGLEEGTPPDLAELKSRLNRLKTLQKAVSGCARSPGAEAPGSDSAPTLDPGRPDQQVAPPTDAPASEISPTGARSLGPEDKAEVDAITRRRDYLNQALADARGKQKDAKDALTFDCLRDPIAAIEALSATLSTQEKAVTALQDTPTARALRAWTDGRSSRATARKTIDTELVAQLAEVRTCMTHPTRRPIRRTPLRPGSILPPADPHDQ